MKKRELFWCLTALVLTAFLIHASVFMTWDARETMALSLTAKTVLIDAGHGAPDGGAVSPNGTEEKGINLEIAKKLKDLVEQAGGRVIMTRTTDEGVYDEGAETLREKKRTDLQNRREMIETGGEDVAVSIHLNLFEQSKYYGAQVFYAPEDETGKRLGETIQKSLVENIRNGNTRAAKSMPSHVYIFKEAKVPSVIVECGFLSNSEEETRLKDPAYQQKLAYCIYLGLISYFENEGRRASQKAKIGF